MTGDEEGRPLPGPATQKTPHPVDRVARGADRRRRRHLRAVPPPRRGLLDPPCSYGLTAAELRAERRRLRAAGWQRWELAAALLEPREVAA